MGQQTESQGTAPKGAATKTFQIKARFTGVVLFECELSAEVAGKEYALQLGFAVRKAAEAGANLAGANLAGADLAGADLAGAYLAGADLAGANLARAKGADLAIARTRILPEGDLIGWKKCREGVIVKLLIPAAAKRSHAFGRKCRAEYAQVLEVHGAEVGVTDIHGPRTEYRVGETVRADAWDGDWQNECSHGIHFYITKNEAENH